MKKNYFAYVNGKDVFVDTKAVEKIIARGLLRGCAKGTVICTAVTALGIAGCFLVDKFNPFYKHSNDAENEETEAF